MKRINKIAASLLLAAALPAASIMGQSTLRSAYFLEGHSYRHQMNPAFASERSYVSMPILGNLNIGMQSNLGVETFLYKNPNGNGLVTFMHESVGSNEFLDKLKKRNRINFDLDMTIFSTGFYAFGGFNTFDLSLKSGIKMNMPKDFFSFLKTGMEGNYTEYNMKDLGLYTNNYAELALGHSHKINDKWNIGAKVKFLIGLYNADFAVKDMKMVLSEDKWEVSGNGEFTSGGMLVIPTKTTVNDMGEAEDELDFDNIEAGDGIGGFGMAFDLGATYQVREDLQLSAAILDLGWIGYKNVTQANLGMDKWDFDGFNNVPYDSDKAAPGQSIEDQIDQLEDDLEDLFKMKASGEGKKKAVLGATLNIGALYTFPWYKKLKFGFLESTRINGKYSWSEGRFSANVAPVKCFDASVSYAISSFGSSFGWVLNLHTRGFNLFLGSNHQFFKVTPQYVPVKRANMNINIGINFPFGSRRSL